MSDAQYGLLEEYRNELFNDQFVLWINIAILWVLVALVVVSHVEQVGTASDASEIAHILSWVVPVAVTQPFWGAALGVIGNRARSVMSR